MATKTQTKTEIRNNTAKIGKLLRGIDNETLAIKKDQDKLNARVKSVQESVKVVGSLVGGISNTALAAPVQKSNGAPAKTAAKPEKKTTAKKPAVKAASAKKPTVKAAPKAKVAKVKTAAKTAPAKKTEKTEKTEPVSNRPALKKVITDILVKADARMGAAEIYKEACQKFGYWSRQSLYNALKDTKSFDKNDEGYAPIAGASKSASSTSDDEVEDLVKKVEKDSATANVV